MSIPHPYTALLAHSVVWWLQKTHTFSHVLVRRRHWERFFSYFAATHVQYGGSCAARVSRTLELSISSHQQVSTRRGLETGRSGCETEAVPTAHKRFFHTLSTLFNAFDAHFSAAFFVQCFVSVLTWSQIAIRLSACALFCAPWWL